MFTLIFVSIVLFQVSVLAFILYRNKYIDRWFILLCLPFIVTEISGLIIAIWGDQHEPFECNLVDFIFNKILIVAIMFIPVSIAHFALKTSANTNKPILFVWKCWSLIQTIMFIAITILLAINKECESIASNDYQSYIALFTSKEFLTIYIEAWQIHMIMNLI